MTEKTLDYYLVLDWQAEKITARKTEPDSTGPYQVVIPVEMEVQVPEPDVPTLSAEVQIPEAQVHRAVSESLYDEDYPAWMETVDSIISQTEDHLAATPEDVNRILGEAMIEAPGAPDPQEVRSHIQERLSQGGSA